MLQTENSPTLLDEDVLSQLQLCAATVGLKSFVKV